ncbi:MAG TPA: tetratricopeptide repeat protein [Xanthobacteraceae bacterium]|nr:tetratricopeptide repeat protein [Xanthobacteraceae bacterium]
MCSVSSFTAVVLLACLAGCATLPESPLVNSSQESGADKSEQLVQLARDIEANGGGETALALYREAVALAGRTPAAYVRLGDAYLRGKKLSAAVEAYRAALAKDPDDAEALLGLGTAFARQGAVAKGLAALAKAAPLVNTGAAYNRLGVAQTIAGQFSEALATFEKGRAVEPGDLDIATNLALAAALDGQSEKAAALTTEIARSPAVQPVHRRNLVIVLGIIGRSAGDARAVAPPELPEAEFEELFSRAASIRRIADPKGRARALGTTMQG